MPIDTKEAIAEAAVRLLTEKNVKKLTVKDIVEECRITRQAFYYHFEDIPELFRWVMEKQMEKLLSETMPDNDPQQTLREFFLMAIKASPYIKRGMQSNYRDELEQIITRYAYRLFGHVIERKNLYRGRTRSEVKLILRYHSQAIMGILREWTDEDTENLDEIVCLVYLLMTEGISPLN